MKIRYIYIETLAICKQYEQFQMKQII